MQNRSGLSVTVRSTRNTQVDDDDDDDDRMTRMMKIVVGTVLTIVVITFKDFYTQDPNSYFSFIWYHLYKSVSFWQMKLN